ncbi:MAG TPA: CHAT domain-containing protein, partial [Myxococcaceae bacterium]|nr:CHAT domain-containing protein [Myxococcaceae bacterium]
CDALVRSAPRAVASYRCYWDLAHTGQRLEAERALEAILRREPDNPGALLFLGLCQDERGVNPDEMLGRAVAAYQRVADPEGEGYARLSLFGYRCLAARQCDENADQLDRTEALAQQHRLTEVLALSLVYRAGAATMIDDVGAAERHLRRADSVIGPDGPAWLRARVLERFGVLYIEAGRHAEARAKLEALAELTRAATPARHAAALGYLGTVALQLAQRHQLERTEAERLLREALDAEARSGLDLHTRYSGSLVTRVQLAFLSGPTTSSLAELEQVKASNERRHSQYPFVALWLLARFTHAHDPAALEAALQYADNAVRRCFRPSHAFERAHGLLVRGDLLWRSGDRVRGIADVRAALDTFEQLRGRQPEASVRARYGASTAFAHQLAAGWMLDPARGPPQPEVAFELMERLRARVLFENLLLAGGQRALLPELRERGQEIQRRISGLQRRLVDPELGAERSTVQRALEAAEDEEVEWNDQVARALPSFRSLEFRPPRLQDIQKALEPDEAMLLFQTWTHEPTPEAPYDDGSSWVLSVSRRTVAAHRIPNADQLEPAIEQWLALLERRDGSDAPGAARLHRDLLAGVLGALGPEVRRLIVVPDGPLHALPFDALRPEESGPLLAEQYAVSIAPSATLWRHWRESEPGSRRGNILALADPDLLQAEKAGATQTWRETGLTLAGLPQARAEADAAAEIGAPGSGVLFGMDASEQRLKSTNLRRFDVVHLATHAIVDLETPARSAVILSSGGEGEDGLVQSREISALDLGPAVVVLASCRSVSGLGVRGEGVVGLGRSFFEAGAHAVVGSLTPLRDDESSALLTSFYRRLAEGSSVSEAMAGARRERIRAGAPPAAWAAMIVLGEGAIRPVPDSVRRDRVQRRMERLIASGGVVVAIGAGALIAWRRRRLGR